MKAQTSIKQIDKLKQMSNTSKDSENIDLIRKTFEPRYGRKLSDKELWEIQFNLRNYAVEIIKIFKSIKEEEQCPKNR